MEAKKFDKIWKKFSEAQTEEEQYAIMKEFMFGATLDELLEWNYYLGGKSLKTWAEHRKTGLSEEDKAFYKEQFAKFDDLEAELKLGEAA